MENDKVFYGDKEVKPTKTGIYKCPRCKGENGYPAPKWKTKKGILAHIEKCPNSDAAIAKAKEAGAQKQEKKQEAEAAFLEWFDEYKKQLPQIGTYVYIVAAILVKDTHEWNGYRMVKVRYERVYRYTAMLAAVEKYIYQTPENLNYKESWVHRVSIYGNNIEYKISDICSSMVEAQEKAKDAQAAHDKANADAAWCR